MTQATGRPAATRALSEADFAAPISDRYFEDYAAGAVYEYGYASVDEAEIVAFAARFDPQAMHVNPERAAEGPFGGLIASGWHTAGIFMRLYADHYLSQVASLASPGIDEISWPAPLRPGDTVRMRTTIVSARRSRCKPDRGLVHTRGELFNQNDQVVLSLLEMNLLRARQAGYRTGVRPLAHAGPYQRGAAAARRGRTGRAGRAAGRLPERERVRGRVPAGDRDDPGRVLRAVTPDAGSHSGDRLTEAGYGRSPVAACGRLRAGVRRPGVQ